MTSRRSWWGWGTEDQAMTDDQVAKLAAAVAARFESPDLEVLPAPDLGAIDLPPPPPAAPPARLEAVCSSDPSGRASHSYGKSFRDLVRACEGVLEHPPDVV